MANEFPLVTYSGDCLGVRMEEIRNEVKVNYRFNLCKLIVLRALDLKGGWHDVNMICMATGLRRSTIAGHLKYWVMDMKDRKGDPVHLLKRTASVSGKRLAWRYCLAPNGEHWLKCVPPELLQEVTNKLILRWKVGLTSYDGGDATLKALAPSLIPSLPLDQITLTNGESIYLKVGDSNYYQGWESRSGYEEKIFSHIPLHCKWTRSKQVAYTALKNLLGDDLPISQTFVLFGLQSEETIIASPIKPDEITVEAKESVEEMHWDDTPGVFRSYADQVHPEDSPTVRAEKMVEARKRYEEIIKKKLESEKPSEQGNQI